MNRIFELVSSCAIISFLALPLIGQQASSSSSTSSRQRPPAATQKPAQEQEKPAETPPTVTKPSEQQSHETKEEEPPVRGLEPNLVDASPVATQHEVRINGKALRYTATAGRLPIRDDAGVLQAEMFFVAYTSDAGTPANQRPLTFAFNGGPGSASLWLHMGALGPRRVVMQPEGWMPASPYRMTDNAYTILDKTDLVMVDAIGTGFSRAHTEKALKHYLSVKGDIEAFGEFIRLYITRNERWSSPLYLLGESYGTTRSAGLSGYLIQRGIAFNGIMLLSTAIDLGTLESPHGNDLPYILILPTYAMAAAYHHKLAPELAQDLAKLRTEVEQWASTTYAQALAKGDNIPAEERQAAIDQMARYTGLTKQVIDDADLRVDVPKFTHNLLLDQKLRIGRLDSRFTGPDPEGVLDTPFFDPSGSQPEPPFTSTFNAYVRTELGYKTDMPYYISGGDGFFKKWDWGNAIEGIPSTAMELRSAMTRDPFLKVLVMEGYYDMATPFFAADYTYDHLQLPPNLRKNLSVAHYDSGHMVYLRQESLVQFKNDVSNFIDSTLGAAK